MAKSVTPILKSLYSGGYGGAMSLCNERIAQKKKTVIFTPNSEIIYKASKSKELLRILNSAGILFPDGIGSYAGMKIVGNPSRERTTGIDLAEMILKEASKRGYKVFMLGAKGGIASKATKKLKSKYKGLDICGHHHGYFDKTGRENDEIIKKINSSGADILFVCFGFPEQEKWIFKNLASLSNVKLAIGLGGSLDVWSDNVKRAPIFVSKIGFEWLWRIIEDPKRLKRVGFLVSFALLVLKESLLKMQDFVKCYEIDNFLK